MTRVVNDAGISRRMSEGKRGERLGVNLDNDGNL